MIPIQQNSNRAQHTVAAQPFHAMEKRCGTFPCDGNPVSSVQSHFENSTNQ